MKQVLPITCLEKIEKIKLYLRGRNERNYFLFCLGINWGIPIQELLELQVEDLREKEFLVRSADEVFSKLAISPQLQVEIANYLGDRVSGPFFPSRSGKELTRRQVYVILREAAEATQLGQSIGICTLRKTFVFWAFKKGVPLEHLRKHLGHSSVRNTIQFVGLPLDEQEAELKPMEL